MPRRYTWIAVGLGWAVFAAGVAVILLVHNVESTDGRLRSAQQTIVQNQKLVTQLGTAVLTLQDRGAQASQQRAQLLQLIRALQRQVRQHGGTPLTLPPSLQTNPQSASSSDSGSGQPPPPSRPRPSQRPGRPSPQPSPSRSPSPKPTCVIKLICLPVHAQPQKRSSQWPTPSTLLLVDQHRGGVGFSWLWASLFCLSALSS